MEFTVSIPKEYETEIINAVCKFNGYDEALLKNPELTKKEFIEIFLKSKIKESWTVQTISEASQLASETARQALEAKSI